MQLDIDLAVWTVNQWPKFVDSRYQARSVSAKSFSGNITSHQTQKTKFDSTVTKFQITKLCCTNWDLKVNLQGSGTAKYFISEILEVYLKNLQSQLLSTDCNMTRSILWSSKFEATMKKLCCFMRLPLRPRLVQRHDAWYKQKEAESILDLGDGIFVKTL